MRHKTFTVKTAAQKMFAVLTILTVVIVLQSIYTSTSPGKNAAKTFSALAGASISLDALVDKDIRQCFNLPKTFDVQTEKEIFQILETSSGTFKLRNAFYDDREAARPTVRITAYSSPDIKVKTFCQLQFAEFDEHIVADVAEYKRMIDGHITNGLDSILISCLNPLARKGLIPKSVSLVESECVVPTNNLQIMYNKPVNTPKKRFALVLKNMNFDDDITTYLIEWVEMVLILGVSKVFVYVEKIHPDTMRTLKYYEAQGIVGIEAVILPEGVEESKYQDWFNEMFSLSDCLYKHMYEYDFLAIFDIDELIVPTRPEDRTWDDLIRRVRKGDKENYEAVDCFYFLLDNNHAGEIQPEVPSNFKMLQHIYKGRKTRASNKSIQSTAVLILANIHWPKDCLGGPCDNVQMTRENAQIQHYRPTCPSGEVCENLKNDTVRDTTLWKYKDELIANFRITEEALKKFNEM